MTAILFYTKPQSLKFTSVVRLVTIRKFELVLTDRLMFYILAMPNL